MSLKNRPCAYCGMTKYPREKGHVIPDCMYPSDTDLQIQRPTVPECTECKKIWQDAENQFRNILVIAGNPNQQVMEQWRGPVRRSFGKPGGIHWAMDIVKQLVPVDTNKGPRYMVYPGRDERVMLVIRKIVRGLCHYHRLGTAIRDQQVWADVLKYQIPEELKSNLRWFSLGLKFLEYGYEVTNDKDNNVHSAWYFKFYEEREFVALISLSKDGW